LFTVVIVEVFVDQAMMVITSAGVDSLLKFA